MKTADYLVEFYRNGEPIAVVEDVDYRINDAWLVLLTEQNAPARALLLDDFSQARVATYGLRYGRWFAEIKALVIGIGVVWQRPEGEEFRIVVKPVT